MSAPDLVKAAVDAGEAALAAALDAGDEGAYREALAAGRAALGAACRVEAEGWRAPGLVQRCNSAVAVIRGVRLFIARSPVLPPFAAVAFPSMEGIWGLSSTSPRRN